MKGSMRLCSAICGALWLLAGGLRGEEPVAGILPEEVRTLAQERVAAGARYLMELQNEDGSWGKYKNPHPAIAALCAMGIHEAPGLDPAEVDAATTKAIAFVMRYRQPDGSIYPAEWSQTSSANYPNYTTSIALMALATLNRPEDREAMLAARRYLQRSQFNDPSSVDYGGIGYGKTGRADLSNASWTTTALHYTDHLDREDPEAEARTREMWEKFAIFLTKCQNLPEVNKESYVSESEEDRGGFVYRPFESKAGSRGEDEQSGLVSSGSMTYAGLMSLLHAQVDRKDVRVRGALDYLMRNWTLSENPGMGLQGLYYYLYVMTRAFDAYGEEILTDKAGKAHPWREEVLKQYMALQHPDGSWANSNGRFMESMPELATSYSLMGMKTALGMNRAVSQPE